VAWAGQTDRPEVSSLNEHIEHVSQSKMEFLEDGITRVDYRTAHKRAGDADYTAWIPETCKACWHQAQAAEEEGDPEPTRPDEEITRDE